MIEEKYKEREKKYGNITEYPLDLHEISIKDLMNRERGGFKKSKRKAKRIEDNEE